VEDQEALTTQLTAETVLPRGGRLLMLGSAGQHQLFVGAFDDTGPEPQ
jgi:hypothetical protein